ncbi:MAG: hypothetical protein KAV87_55690 [Desulfobacteraceae bacterium]|nr:hypothetical protein [Desulfobacteraceae bacterium]
MRLKLGRFRLLFKRDNRAMTIRWFGFSVGYETVRFRKWKKRLRDGKK